MKHQFPIPHPIPRGFLKILFIFVRTLKKKKEKEVNRTSRAIQWLRLCAPKVGSVGSLAGLMLEKIVGRRKKGVTEDEMVGWHHRLNGHEFEQTLGDGKGQGSLVCCDSWGHKESDRTE